MPYTIDEIRTKAMPIAIRYGVDTLSLFGSYARGEADEKSDLDFLIQKGNMKGLLSYCGMIADLEDVFQCHVDLVVKSAIKDKQFLEAIGKDEVKLYAR
ncbi:MAG: nucleotidyltransferase domain-containing protein [bacterium]|nr:nucleotidyltransferase domain-containing protein [bacterium]